MTQHDVDVRVRQIPAFSVTLHHVARLHHALAHHSRSQRKITCKVGRRPIGPTNVTVELATQVSNGHSVRLECPKGHIADPQSLLCSLPGAEGEVVVSTTSVIVAVVLGAALLLLLLLSRRLYRQKGARTLSALFASRGLHLSLLLTLLRRGRSRRRRRCSRGLGHRPVGADNRQGASPWTRRLWRRLCGEVSRIHRRVQGRTRWRSVPARGRPRVSRGGDRDDEAAPPKHRHGHGDREPPARRRRAPVLGRHGAHGEGASLCGALSLE